MNPRSPGATTSLLARAVAAFLLCSTLCLTLVAASFSASAAAAATTAATETATGDDVTWGVRTAENPNGTDRENFTYTVEPGAELSDAFIVTNHDAEPLELLVYAADGFTTSSGQLDLVTADTASIAVGAWSTLDANTVWIEPGASLEIPFTVTVPGNTTPGDYAGGILTALPVVAQDEGVTVDRRLGIRMHIRVLGDLAPSVAVEDLHVEYTGSMNPFGGGDAVVSYTVQNSGNTRLAAEQSVTLAGPLGALPSTATGLGAVPELLPGESWTVTVPVDNVFATFWLTASSVLTPSVPAVADAVADGVADADGVAPEIEPVETRVGVWAVPWATLILVVLVVGGTILAVVVTRRRRARRTLREAARVEEAVAEALRTREQPDPATHPAP